MIEILMLAAQLTAIDLTFADAKWQADAYEAALTSKDRATLVEAQGKALGAAITVCGPAKDTYPAFTIVAHVGGDGVTDRTWRGGDSEYAVCMERALSNAALPLAAGKPFYTSYELSFGR